jgi:hypothetical protein
MRSLRPGGNTGPLTLAELSFTGPAEPFTFFVSATNEWMTTVPGAQVWAMPNQLKATIPTWNVYGNTAVITGSVAATPQSRQVVLQARNSPTSPWYVVQYYWTLGSIRFDLMPGAGTRRYRLWVANYTTKDHAYFGGYSAPVTMTTVGTVPLKNGFGRVAYRYYVPTHTWRGLPVTLNTISCRTSRSSCRSSP